MIDALRPALTDRQRQIYELICAEIQSKRRPPTLQELADRMGYRSKNAVENHLTALEKKGYIDRQPLTARSIQVTDLTVYRRPFSLPIMGRVSAGQLMEACELLDWLSLEDLLGLDDGNLAAFQVEGDGGLDRNVCHGDYIIRRGDRDVLLWRSLEL